MKKMWYMYPLNTILPEKAQNPVISNLDKPKFILPGKISQRQKDKHCIIPSYVESKMSDLTEAENGIMATMT